MNREQLKQAIEIAAKAIEQIVAAEHPSKQPEMIRRVIGEVVFGAVRVTVEVVE